MERKEIVRLFTITYQLGRDMDSIWTAGVLAMSGDDAVDYLKTLKPTAIIKTMESKGDVHAMTDKVRDKITPAQIETIKTSKTKPEIKKTVLEPDKPVKRGRGRPRGSQNK